ncbi:hypothetical protein [Streptomyces albireticuli]|uniref:hypothetical protein n=1 Tax=Streptomyces albireticuli TaxID=1940 RepID=UPI00368AEC7B
MAVPLAAFPAAADAGGPGGSGQHAPPVVGAGDGPAGKEAVSVVGPGADGKAVQVPVGGAGLGLYGSRASPPTSCPT